MIRRRTIYFENFQKTDNTMNFRQRTPNMNPSSFRKSSPFGRKREATPPTKQKQTTYLYKSPFKGYQIFRKEFKLCVINKNAILDRRTQSDSMHIHFFLPFSLFLIFDFVLFCLWGRYIHFLT